jgi:hypothetical protein
MRFVASHEPRNGPCLLIASIAYWLHVGVNRHCPPSRRPSVTRYSRTSWISNQRISAMHDTSSVDDARLLQSFEDCTLPFVQWTHRCHVKVAYLYLRHFSFDEALVRIRNGIKAYNAANKVPEGPTSGYNETTTHAMVHLIAATMRAYDGTFPTSGADSFCDTHSQLMTRHVLRLFYSPQRRMDPLAKTQFVEPDLAPLPRIL